MPASRPFLRRVASLLLLLTLVSGSAGCTLVKPVVGAVAGPVVAIGAVGLPPGCGCRDYGCAVLAYVTVAAIAGATCGLVTGVISDVQALTGTATEPTKNWENPFALNTSDRW